MRPFGQGLLKLEIDVLSGSVCLAAPATGAVFEPDSDYFRLFLDDDDEKEILVRSRDQQPEFAFLKDRLIIRYARLKAVNGQVYDVSLDMNITEKDEALCFEPFIRNQDERVRLNEMQYPYVQAGSFGGSRADDVLYYPRAFGMRLPDPWTALDRYHTEYRSKDDQGIWMGHAYPGVASMAWLGLQSGSCFFYLAQHDPDARICVPAAGRQPRGAQPELRLTLAGFPALTAGETERMAPHVLAVWPGDWRRGADAYRAFITSAFYHPQVPPDWVRAMAGWQRIIMKHQYGEILYRYDDLPELYRQGKPAGLDTLLVFGWWKGRFDNSYPHYEPDEKMGGAARLRLAIETIQAEGGRVILYTNGCLIDLQSPYYKNGGSRAAMLDIDRNEYREHYHFAGEGFTLRQFGYKSFALGCMSTQGWADRLIDQGQLMKKFAPDSIFYDQIAGHPTKLCFNAAHPHGRRVDRDWSYRPSVFRQLRALCSGDLALGTENITDIGCCQADYTHNSSSVKPSDPNLFPYLFRYVLPEIITTNRTVQEEYPGYKDDLTYAFIFGLRYCVSIYRCRGHLGQMPEYTRHLAWLNDLRRRYQDYLVYGSFTVTHADNLADDLVRTEYRHADGRRLLQITWNRGSSPVTCAGRQIAPGALDFAEQT
jgi:hypothetical protein